MNRFFLSLVLVALVTSPVSAEWPETSEGLVTNDRIVESLLLNKGLTSIFADGFESGNLCGWQSGGALCVSPAPPHSATAPIDNNEARAQYIVRWTLTAGSSNVFVEKTMRRGVAPESEYGIWGVVQTSSGAVYEDGVLGFQAGASCPCPLDTATHFGVEAGMTRSFLLFFDFNNEGETAGQYAARLTGLTYDGSGNDDNGDNLLGLTPGTGYATSPVFVASANTLGEPFKGFPTGEYRLFVDGQEWSFVGGIAE